MLTKRLNESKAALHGGFGVGGVCVRMSGKCEGDVALVPALEPFRVDGCGFDIDIQVEWVARIPLARGRKTFDSGTTWRLHESDVGLGFDFHSQWLKPHPYKRLLMDTAFTTATIHMSEEYFETFYCVPEPLGYPLDELLIMHRLTQEKAIELHGAGIVRPNGVGNLFVGHSGAGKSTTTRLWTSREEVEVLSDDRIIVRRDEARAVCGGVVETPRRAGGAVGKHEVLRLHDCSASRTNHFAQDDNVENRVPPSSLRSHGRNDKGKVRMYGTPWHGEAMFASPNSAPLTRIFVLEHGHGNVVTRLSPSQAVAELFARSFVPFHRHEYVESALDFLEELTEAVPCYRYSFEPNMGAVEKILQFRD